VLGYFVEATTTQHDKVKADTRFIQRQSTANATRFTTVELGELETKISQAADKAVALELRLFADLVGEVTARADGISKTAGALALIDVAAGLADLAETELVAAAPWWAMACSASRAAAIRWSKRR
jgi:DNA mismatch repair protein MutS